MTEMQDDKVKNEIAKVQRAVARARKLRGMTQLQLGAKINMLPTTLSAIERGRRVPNTHTLAKIAAALDMTIEELIKAAGDQDS